jgi:membrane protein insertase Oxa1/YidC/SpoIIIJ
MVTDAPVAASTSSFVDTVVAPVQAGLLSLHESTGLPWWATLALTAVGVRMAFLPVVYYQV